MSLYPFWSDQGNGDLPIRFSKDPAQFHNGPKIGGDFLETVLTCESHGQAGQITNVSLRVGGSSLTALLKTVGSTSHSFTNW